MTQFFSKHLIHGILLIFLGTFLVGLSIILTVIFLPDPASTANEVANYIGQVSFYLGILGAIVALVGCFIFVPSTLHRSPIKKK